ncbi:MAG: helix-turn-helix domain-containing protein [Lachnospiraceae bacterium]|nr:helix-turn-helix domain-containing protein [Lachnospiraceae bacterium]
MRYKIYNEPMYDFECKSILFHIINGTSIKKEMEDCIEEHNAESARPLVEKSFAKSFAVEKYIKENINFNLPGYEETGRETSEFLFREWEDKDAALIDAIYAYDHLLPSEIESKAIIIMLIIDPGYVESIWSLKSIEEGSPPPFISDNEFFRLIDNSQLGQEEKLKALKLYYEFDSYHDYASKLFRHAEDLLKVKIEEYADEIKTHMNQVEQHLLSGAVYFLKKRIGISPNDDQFYHIYPSLYHANMFVLNVTGFSPPFIIIGTSVFSLEDLYEKVDSDNDKAARFLKCLSDNTKQNILQQLKKEPLYGSQLAEKLGCTSANISQHMNILINLDVVHVKKENNRVYFHLNKAAIHQHFDTAKELFG